MYLQDIGNASMDVLNHYPGPIMIAASVAASSIVALLVMRWMQKQNQRRIADEDMKRRAILDQKYADGFGDVLFDMLHAGIITRHEYKRDCKRFGIAYRLSDLLVKKNPKRGMHYRVRKNIAESHHTPDLRGKIPGPKPGSDTPVAVVVVKRKTWLVKSRVIKA